MDAPVIKPLLFETYLVMIKNAVGTKMFQSGFAEVDGVKTEITKSGDLSCAFFVSSFLKIFDLIDGIHVTVDGTTRALEQADWQKTKELKPGSVLIWESQIDEKGENHKHIGFYLGDDQAISNDSKSGTPVIHNVIFNNAKPRYIITIYWSDKLK
ncbi:MAG: hypothetical protein HYV76_00765 [Candidatus Vogelbacteria bacterium]|nr:hypothetical protein [Candidatus Vogelbacteria bacterium]